MDANLKRLALHRVQSLLDLAIEAGLKDQMLAQRYASLARKMAMAAKIRIPQKYRHLICPGCDSFMMPGKNSRVRIKQHREPHVTVTCLSCGKKTRIGLRKRGRS